MKKVVGLLRAGVNIGQPKLGVELAPNLIRDTGIFTSFSDVAVRDFGEITKSFAQSSSQRGVLKNLDEFLDVTSELKAGVGKMVRSDIDMGLLLGGDHSIACGSIMGHLTAREEETCLIWVDAHTDINPPCSTLTGNLHGCPVSFICEEVRDRYNFEEIFAPLRACISAKNMAYIGLRDLDSVEKEILQSLDIMHFTSMSVEEMGIKRVMAEILQGLDPEGRKMFHLSFDIDSLDPTYTPSTGTPVEGGLTIREGLYICDVLQNTNRLKFVDLVELNPLIGSPSDCDKTLKNTLSIIRALFGHYHT